LSSEEAKLAMVEMRVAGIALDAASRSPIVLLRDPSARRQVPIWIDQAQAQNILAGLNGVKPPRPLSHDLMVSLMAAGQLTLEKVIIHAIEDNTFRAVLKLSDASGGGHELDARPSDAIALALRTDAGIWMLEEVVGDASIPVDAEADAEDQEDFRRFLERTSPAELIRHLGKAIPEEGEADASGGEPTAGEGRGETVGEPGEAGPAIGAEAEADIPTPPQASAPDLSPPAGPGTGTDAAAGQGDAGGETPGGPHAGT
jgi:bifunctional DNase/RNase